MRELEYVIEYIFFPSSLLSGSILALCFTSVMLPILWRVYQKEYSFTKKEKMITFLLSFLFMMVCTVAPHIHLPILIGSLLAFHFMVDRKYMELPDGVNLFIALFAIYQIIMNWIHFGFMRSGILSGVIMFAIFLLLGFVGPMGGGDIKLMGAIGLYFTLWDLPSIFLYGFLIGSLQGIGLMIEHRRGRGIIFPFGPALILGILTTIWLKGGMIYV